MRRLDTSKRVTLPNGRTFVARYKCVSRAYLPVNVIDKGQRPEVVEEDSAAEVCSALLKN